MRLYTSAQAATKLGISGYELSQLVEKGVIKVVDVGDHDRISEDAITTYLEQKQRELYQSKKVGKRVKEIQEA